MVFIQSNDRKGRYEFRAIQESCKMRSMYKNEIRAKQENNDTCKSVICKSVIHTQQFPPFQVLLPSKFLISESVRRSSVLPLRISS